MWALRIILALALAFGLAACGSRPGKLLTYNGPEVTSIQVHKGARQMYLLHEGKVLKTYKIALGFAPEGHKQIEGDGKTPEGTYFIDRRNPNSNFHLSLGVSYPNEQDIARALAAGEDPGGDIFVHGRSHWRDLNKGDWTAGCIAVRDAEMDEVYAMVKLGTTIHILP
ncbi:MAG: L,D-transpeptidase family protein [Paracoccaceae bacterium]|nr:L,D-transpeptidase family protein [Paracoccaceae bacterium]